MTRILLSVGALFLTGCPHGDYVSPDYPANVSIQNNSICVKVAPEGDEKIRNILIYDVDNMDDQVSLNRKPYEIPK